MRNLKKLLAVIIAICVLATFAVPAFAADDFKYAAEAQKLNDLGLYKGISTTSFNPDLGSFLNRETGVVMLLRILGLESKALEMTDVQVSSALSAFTDVDEISSWAKKSMAYAVANGLILGTSAIHVSPKVFLSGQMYCALLYRAMGYKDNYATVVADLGKTGALTDAQVTAFKKLGLTKDDLVGISYGALKGKNSDGKTLAQVLIANGVITEAKAIAAGVFTAPAVALAVESVTASNLAEIFVKFNKAVDKTTAETAGNYVFTTTGPAVLGTPVLQADGVTVKLPLTTAAANQNKIDIKIQNVKDAAGTAITAVTKSITLFDVAIPEAQSYAFTGPTTIEVTFSEPVNAAGTALVDNGIYGATAAVHATKKNVVVVTLGTTLPEGTHTLKLTGATDFVTYTALDKVFDITYAKDTSLPTVSISASTQKKVTLKFSKEVKGDALLTTRFYHTYTSYTPVAVTDAAGGAINTANYYDTVIVDFTNNPLPAGTTNVVVLKTVGSISITDRYGNVMAADATLPASVTADTTAPTITKVEATSETTFVVTFSEDVTGAGTKANYVFKKADGTVIATSAYNTPVYAAGTTFTATFTFSPALAGGAYSVEVSNIKDASLSANAMAMVPQPFTVSDKTAITTATAIAKENAGTTADVIYITFPENMATSGANSVLDKANYKIGNSGAANAAAAVALDTNATIELFGSNDKVKVTLPGTGGADLTGKSLFVRNIADASGNVLSAIYLEIAPAADAAPVITAIKATAKNTFVYTSNKQLSAINAADFTVGGVAVSQATYVNNTDGTATITLIVPAAQALANEGTLPSGLAIAGTNTKSITGTAIAVDADILVDGDAGGPEIAVTPTDAIAPAVASYVFVDATRIDVNFTENIDANSVALAGKNGFSVSGGTLTTALLSGTNKIILTGTSFTADTDVIYTPGNITDNATGTKNALAAINRTDALTAGALTLVAGAGTITATSNYDDVVTGAVAGTIVAGLVAGVQPVGHATDDLEAFVTTAFPAGLTNIVLTPVAATNVITISGTAGAAVASTTITITVRDKQYPTVTKNFTVVISAGVAGALTIGTVAVP